MELSLLLGKVVGIYLLVMGISLLIRKETWMHVVKKYTKNSALMMAVATAELIVGLLIVLTHNIWVNDWVVVVTVIGWLMFIEGVVYLLLPVETMKKLVKSFNKPAYYKVCGIIALVLGILLTYITFTS